MKIPKTLRRKTMKISNISADITKELQETVAAIDDAQAELLADKIVGAKRIFLAGAGRSLLMVKCCAMRLMQLGFTAYVTGETVTPSITKDDLLIVVSGSGETGTIVLMTNKAKKIGAEVACITIAPESSVGRAADLVIQINAASTKLADNSTQAPSIQLGGARFELSVLLLLEGIVMAVVEKAGITDPNVLLMQNHANLE